MNKKNTVAVLSGLLLAAAALAEDEVPERFTYATYLYCNTAKEHLADDYVEKSEGPLMDKLVDDGVFRGWGWMRHHTGGQWRRIRYFQADSLKGALEALGKMGEAMNAALGEDAVGVGAACHRHDDYIWRVKAGTSGAERGKAGLSVYFNCEITAEDRADEIVANDFAPVYNKLVKDGKIASWGWQSHVIGGGFRRLFTMTAGDFGALVDARAEALAAQYGEDNEAGIEFASICGKHADYLWNIVHEKQATD